MTGAGGVAETAPGAAALIELSHVHKRFARQIAVDDLTLRVARGEIYGLLGHNGAGKSTAIGMMLGQVWPTAGAVRIFGHDVTTRRAEALRKVGAIFETPVFYDYLSGWRNLDILSHYTARTPPQRIGEVLDWVGLTGRERSKVSTYSHGMRARLALAQALLPHPELLVLDEPSDGLDPEGIHEMRETVLRLNRELRLTILLSSHLLNEVQQLCTRIAVLKRGRKVFEGNIQEALGAETIHLRVEDFTGATQALLEAGLIKRPIPPDTVVLGEGVGTDAVVEFLVGRRIPVYEICREQQTLERFYLSLVKEE